MPELPDLTVYAECCQAALGGRRFLGLRLASPFLLRTAAPPASALVGGALLRCFRQDKRLVFELTGERFLALHLMIAGRLRLLPPGAAIPGRVGLAALDFEGATLAITEASKTRRAALHLLEGRPALTALRRDGVEPLQCTTAEFAAALRRERRTLKRALTDPDVLAGVGNAYSDEILHAARLSPVRLTDTLDDATLAALHAATVEVLTTWTERLRAEARGAQDEGGRAGPGPPFPTHVTAFREGMAVHGRYGQPCPRCGAPVQRIRHAENEANYCPPCQTGGKLLADRGLSRLLGKDWPRSLEELEERRATGTTRATRARAVTAPPNGGIPRR